MEVYGKKLQKLRNLQRKSSNNLALEPQSSTNFVGVPRRETRVESCLTPGGGRIKVTRSYARDGFSSEQFSTETQKFEEFRVRTSTGGKWITPTVILERRKYKVDDTELRESRIFKGKKIEQFSFRSY